MLHFMVRHGKSGCLKGSTEVSASERKLIPVVQHLHNQVEVTLIAGDQGHLWAVLTLLEKPQQRAFSRCGTVTQTS